MDVSGECSSRLTLALLSARTSEVIIQESWSWENELAWNEGTVPSQSPELATSGCGETLGTSSPDNLEIHLLLLAPSSWLLATRNCFSPDNLATHLLAPVC